MAKKPQKKSRVDAPAGGSVENPVQGPRSSGETIPPATSLTARKLNAITDEYNDRLRELGFDPRDSSYPNDHPNAKAADEAYATYRRKSEETVDRQVEINVEELRTSHVPATWHDISVHPESRWQQPPNSLADLREWVAYWRDFNGLCETMGVERLTAQQKWAIFRNGHRSLEKLAGSARTISNAATNALGFEQKMAGLLVAVEAAIGDKPPAG
jgi:hypothetical protein